MNKIETTALSKLHRAYADCSGKEIGLDYDSKCKNILKEYKQLIREEEREAMGVGFLRQWLNENRLDRLYTNDDLMAFLKIRTSKKVREETIEEIMNMVRWYSKDTWSQVWDCINLKISPDEMDDLSDEELKALKTNHDK